MKRLILVSLLLLLITFSVDAQDQTKVVPFSNSLITTGRGVKSHVAWAEFPSKDVKIRKILLKLTLATPQEDYMSCAHWDYLDQLIVRRVGGQGGESLNYEISRMLTPYGGRNPKDWSFTWEVDVTDFSSILRDSVEFDYIHHGWESSTDRGWALTTNFEITYGEPAYSTIAIHKVYDKAYNYGFVNDPIENHLKPYEIQLSPKTNYLRSVTFQTGHGSDSLANSEFSPKWRKLFWNGEEVSHKVLWTEGGDNPLYPQAGTWIYDRGNWIPGMLINPDVCDIIVKGGTTGVFDLNMEPYEMPINPSAVQNISSYLVEYKVNKKALDVELMDIIVPSLKQIHSRKNPTTGCPVILVKNHSAQPIHSMTIRYGKHTDQWKGTIAPFGVEEITLAQRVDNSSTLFEVEIVSVNGKKDNYPKDNSMSSPYAPAPVHKGNLSFVLNGNTLSPKENSVTLYNITTGERVFNYSIGEVTKIKEDHSLNNGDYLFEVTDTKGDGLNFWANKKAGYGECFIKTPDNKLVKYFNPDFGNSIRYWFSVDNTLKEENTRKEPYVKVTYNEKNKPILNYVLNNDKGEVKFVIKSYVGKIIQTITRKGTDECRLLIDMTQFPLGMYFIEVWQNGCKTDVVVYVDEKK